MINKIKTFLNNIFVLLSLFMFSNASALTASDDAASACSQTAILAGINAYRSESGLGKLKMNAFLSEEAARHSREMAENMVPFGHDGFKKRMYHIFKKLKSRAIAENVAYANADPQTIVELWLNSPGHRENIEGDYNLTGIGMAYDKLGRVYVTQIFLRCDDISN